MARRALAALPAREVAEPVLLGLDGDAALFAVDLDGLGAHARAGFAGSGRTVGLRDAGALLRAPRRGSRPT